MPAFKLMLIFVEEDIKRLLKPIHWEGSATFRHWREKNGDFNGRDTTGIRLWHAILAILEREREAEEEEEEEYMRRGEKTGFIRVFFIKKRSKS